MSLECASRIPSCLPTGKQQAGGYPSGWTQEAKWATQKLGRKIGTKRVKMAALEIWLTESLCIALGTQPTLHPARGFLCGLGTWDVSSKDSSPNHQIHLRPHIAGNGPGQMASLKLHKAWPALKDKNSFPRWWHSLGASISELIHSLMNYSWRDDSSILK